MGVEEALRHGDQALVVVVGVATVLSLLAAAAVHAAAAVLAGTGRGRTAVRVLLDLLIAVGLLRLATPRGWADLMTAVAVIVLRQLPGFSRSRGRPGRAADRRRPPGGTAYGWR